MEELQLAQDAYDRAEVANAQQLVDVAIEKLDRSLKNEMEIAYELKGELLAESGAISQAIQVILWFFPTNEVKII